jgi:lipopolysaccharide export system protein LptA
LRIFENKRFEFESRGLERQGELFSGTIELKADTIIFNYKDSIPKAGTKAIIGNGRILFIDGAYPESVEIKLNEL